MGHTSKVRCPSLPALLVGLLALLGSSACKQVPTFEGGVGSDNEGCGLEGTNSVVVGESSCACEPGYSWCTEELGDFECCLDDSASEGADEGSLPPQEICDEDGLEQLRCVPDPADPNPAAATVWACNGERWVEVPGYADFACAAEGLPFAYGCVPGPQFLCGFGTGSTCEVEGYSAICVDEDIIDTCVWGRRTVDRCSRLCAELGAFGEGFSTGICDPPLSKFEAARCLCE